MKVELSDKDYKIINTFLNIGEPDVQERLITDFANKCLGAVAKELKKNPKAKLFVDNFMNEFNKKDLEIKK